MPHRPRLVLTLAAAGVAVALAAAAVLLWPGTAITRANAARVRSGMTRAEVEAVLGGPPRDEVSDEGGEENRVTPDYSGDDAKNEQLWIAAGMRMAEADLYKANPQCSEWRSDQVTLIALFGADGRVADCIAIPTRRPSDTFWPMLRRWFRL